LAISQAALGGRVRLYAHEHAVTMLAPGVDDDGATLAAAGLPDRPALLALAVDAGVTLIACQTGLALAGLAIDALATGVIAGGLMGLLAELDDDRLVTI
jgi:predicted peroxiredoxin